MFPKPSKNYQKLEDNGIDYTRKPPPHIRDEDIPKNGKNTFVNKDDKGIVIVNINSDCFEMKIYDNHNHLTEENVYFNVRIIGYSVYEEEYLYDVVVFFHDGRKISVNELDYLSSVKVSNFFKKHATILKEKVKDKKTKKLKTKTKSKVSDASAPPHEQNMYPQISQKDREIASQYIPTNWKPPAYNPEVVEAPALQRVEDRIHHIPEHNHQHHHGHHQRMTNKPLYLQQFPQVPSHDLPVKSSLIDQPLIAL